MRNALKATAAAVLFCLALIVMAVFVVPALGFGLGYWLLQQADEIVQDLREQKIRQQIADKIAQLSGRGQL